MSWLLMPRAAATDISDRIDQLHEMILVGIATLLFLFMRDKRGRCPGRRSKAPQEGLA